jgi:hypothetical protein
MFVSNYDRRNTQAVHIRRDILDNKGLNLEINWFITLEALREWNKTNSIREPTEIRYFISNRLTIEKIENFLIILKEFINKFDGYPSSTIKTKNAYCVFCFSNGKIVQQIGLSDDLTYFYLYIDVIGIKTDRASHSYVIKHELYHGISRAKENEKRLVALMQNYSQEEEHILKRHFANIQLGIKELEKYIERGGTPWKNVHDVIKSLQKEDSSLHYLYRNEFGAINLLLNMIADSILTILAMEIHDDYYVKEAVDGDEHNLRNLVNQIRYIKHTRKVMEEMKDKQTGDTKLIFETREITLILIELLLFFRHLPIRGMPLLVVRDKFRTGQLNKYYRGSHYMRARRNNELYLSEAKECVEYSFIEWFLNSYLVCISHNTPKINEPFKELHQNFNAYEQLGLHLKQKLLHYLDRLDKNIGTLRSKKIWF